MKKIILIMCGIVFLSGCFSEQKRVKKIKIEKQKIVTTDTNEKLTDVIIATYPTQLRGTYFKNGLHCAEPAPDVGVSTEAKLIDKIEIKGTVQTLEGRDSTVLLTREMLYRICEMGMNYPDKSNFKEIKALYLSVVDAINNLAIARLSKETQKQIANSKVVEAHTKNVNAVKALLKDGSFMEILKTNGINDFNILELFKPK